MTIANLDDIQRELDRALGEDTAPATGFTPPKTWPQQQAKKDQIVPRAFSNTAQGSIDQAAALLREVMEGADSIIRAETIIKDAAGKLAEKLIEARKLIQAAKDRL